MTAVETLIKKLAEAWGPPGFEHQVRDLIREEVAPLADAITVDPLGNLICRVGDGDARVMVAAHMDELGVIVSHIDRQGYARFASLGTLLPGTLLGARVRFENGVIANIGVENQYTRRRDLPTLDGFFIDISLDADGSAPVQVGDPGAFVREVVWRGERVVGKALDDRLGCAVQIEAMRRLKDQGTPHTVYFVFTVQEEVGSRGARPAGYGVEPHLAIAVDVSPAGDVPKPKDAGISLGGGAVIKVRDTGHIVPAPVKNLMIRRAEERGIPYQLEVMTLGSTDGAEIQLARSGVPTGAVGIPARYVHTQSETADRRDIQAAIDLLVAILSEPVEL